MQRLPKVCSITGLISVSDFDRVSARHTGAEHLKQNKKLRAQVLAALRIKLAHYRYPWKTLRTAETTALILTDSINIPDTA